MIPTERNNYGGFWIRFGAYVVDCVVLLIPTLLISFLYRAGNPPKNDAEDIFMAFGDVCMDFTVWWVYTAVLLSSPWQATVGKKVCGLKVVNHEGNRITFGRATGRYFASVLSVVTLFIGFVMIAWTSKRQALHDLIAETFIVKEVARTG